MDRASPADELLESVRSHLAASKADATERARTLEALVAAYVAAIEADAVRRFCEQHAVRLPAGARETAAPAAAARALLAEVLRLPECAGLELARTAEPRPVAAEPPPSPALPAPPAARAKADRAAPPARPPACLDTRPIVVVGGQEHAEKLSRVDAAVVARLEWVETERAGTTAIAALARRVREERVAGVVILEALVRHKHSQPVVDAARQHGVPVVYARSGGRDTLAKALEALAQLAPGRADPGA